MDPAVAFEIQGLSYQQSMNEVMELGTSQMQSFYSGLTVFVTGGSGFIGKQLIEKLFRSCEILKAFVLIRAKPVKDTQERLAEMLSDPVFEAVRRKKPYFDERIVAVEGDVTEIGLAINEEDWATITQEVDMIFHVAATTRFDEALRLAVITNVRGTREVFKLGKACKKLKSIVHVSTAYSHTTSRKVGGELMEDFYECPVSPDVIIELAEVDSDQLDKFTSSIIKEWPNTYTFTKALAEEVVRNESGSMRVTIVRPSIVLCSFIEPVPGWLDRSCMYGPSGIVIGVGLGVIRVLRVNNTNKLSFVPIDYVNNATIAAGWDAAERPTGTVSIFNISTTNCGVTFKHISKPMRTLCRSKIPSLAMWYPFMYETNSRVMYWFLSWILHYIPAYTVDAAIKLFKLKKPKELKSFVEVYKKYDKFVKVYDFFLTNEWNFNDDNLTRLWLRMTDADRQIFNFEMKSVDWDWFTMMLCLGVRKYILKDGLKNTSEAVKKQKLFKLGNYAVIVIYLFVLWQIIRLFYHVSVGILEFFL